MVLNPRTRSARRTLATLVAIALALVGIIGLTVQLSKDEANPASRALTHPKLGLDLEGGTEMILEPITENNVDVNAGQLEQARNIIRQRIDANGVAETEITTRGAKNIVISIPGTPTKQQLDAVRKPTQLRFRAVLAVGSGSPMGATATGTPVGEGTPGPVAPTPAAPGNGPAVPAAPATPSAPPSTAAPAGIPFALEDPTAPAAPAPVAPAPADPTAPATPGHTMPVNGSQWTPGTPLVAGMVPTPTSTAAPTNGSDVNWVTPEVLKQWNELNCSDRSVVDGLKDDPANPLVTCDDTGAAKYILGPVEVDGKNVVDSAYGYEPGPNGQPTNVVQVTLKFDNAGGEAFGNVTKRLFQFRQPRGAAQDVRNQFAIVLDKFVISAPGAESAITNGEASIRGSFTMDSAKQLSQQLKFGALPMSFTLKNQDNITPTLGGEQLRLGLLAGLIGFLLVCLYSLGQYRALGFVTIASLLVAAGLTYALVTLLGYTHNLRLTMAGVTGLIVAIGVTADSFIVYFERIRDEVREGRTLVAAVETGWKRARRTILAADFVNFLAAAVLYLLASDKVRGFAFTLGLTTIIDIIVVFMFTHPLVSILAHTKFFGGGHKWSGLDPERLGATSSVRYRGRGQFTGLSPDKPTTPPARPANEGAQL